MSFADAANRVPLTTLGVLQYITPILHLGSGVLVFHEPMPPARLAAFALVWLALAVFTWDGLHSRAVTRRLRVVDGRGRIHAQAAGAEGGMKLRYATFPPLRSLRPSAHSR
jgi:hypothetical protein